MKALLYESAGRLALREVAVPTIGDGEALVAVEACGLCGSDILKIDSRIRELPVPLGHELAGRIVELGAGVKGFKKGDRVVVAHHVPCLDCHYCRRGSESMCREFKRSNLDPGGFSQFTRVSSRHVRHTMLKIPKGLAFERAAMTEPLACCLRNVRRMRLTRGDTAVVVGLGFIGLMTSQLLAREGVAVIGLDLDPIRVRLAQKLGVERAYTGKEGNAQSVVLSETGGRGADALVFTAGTPGLVAERLSWVRDGGTVNVFAGFRPDSTLHLDLDALYHRELTLMSSYSPQLEDLRAALALIAEGAVDVDPYTRERFPLERYEEALRRVRGREIVKAVFAPSRS